jgi:lipooligosaccharide transport system permease protein
VRSITKSIPTRGASVFQVWYRNLLIFRKTWKVNVFWIALEPFFFLVAIGYGLGSFVPDISGISYAEFFFPALLCTTSMMVAFFECSYSNFSKLNYQNTYSTMILSPLQPHEILWGELLWGATKGLLSALSVILIGQLFGLGQTLMVFPALIVIAMNSLLFAVLGMLVTTLVRNYDGIIYPTSGLIIPMSLFSGTYYPKEQLPELLYYLSYVFPLTHFVDMTRMALVEGSFSWWSLLSLLYVGVLFYFLLKMTHEKLLARLFS